MCISPVLRWNLFDRNIAGCRVVCGLDGDIETILLWLSGVIWDRLSRILEFIDINTQLWCVLSTLTIVHFVHHQMMFVICMTHFLRKCWVNGREGGRGNLASSNSLVLPLIYQWCFPLQARVVNVVNKTENTISTAWIWGGHMIVCCNECDECLYWLSEDQTGRGRV